MNINIKRYLSRIFPTCLLLISTTPSCLAFPVDFAPGTPVVDAVRALGMKSNYNVIINGNLKGTLAMHMNDTNFEEAIRAMSIAGNFSYEFSGNTVLVGPAKELNTMETFRLNHLEPELIAKQLELLVDDGDVVINNDNHTIAVKGSSSILNRVRDQIIKLDKAQQQINIKATVIELSKTKTRNMGLSYMSDIWQKDTSIAGYNGFKFTITGAHEENLGNGNVLARPNITTFDGRKATILMGDKVPVFTSSSTSSSAEDVSLSVEYKEVGVKLEVVPRINERDKETITMTIKPSVSTISQWVESGNNKAPQISERSAETTVRVKAGETILLGGLLKDEEIKNIKAIPFISKLPVLGELFKSRSIDKKNTEILIAITPTIIHDEDGRPQVELQETVPSLHRKLEELQGEDTEINKSEKAVLKKQNELIEAKLAAAKKELAELKRNNTALRKEMHASNESMKKAIASLEAEKEAEE